MKFHINIILLKIQGNNIRHTQECKITTTKEKKSHDRPKVRRYCFITYLVTKKICAIYVLVSSWVTTGQSGREILGQNCGRWDWISRTGKLLGILEQKMAMDWHVQRISRQCTVCAANKNMEKLLLYSPHIFSWVFKTLII